MVSDFDERNLAKSRAVCAAMAESADTDKRVLSEKERRILDMWPRYEDGEYLWFGDAYVDTDGDDNEVQAVELSEACADLVGLEGFHTGFEPGERVERPAPKVLDADGVEIKVGDTVWHHSGFAHGVVTSIDAGSLMGTVRYVNGGVEFRDAAKDLTHARPDSWERLEEDAAKHPCLCAADVKGSKFDSCSDCPWNSECEITAKEVRQENDAVASPAHYTSGGIEAKDALKSAMAGSGLSPMASYWWGCAFKYLWRWTRKNGLEDLRKCRQCIDFLIEEVEGE